MFPTHDVGHTRNRVGCETSGPFGSSARRGAWEGQARSERATPDLLPLMSIVRRSIPWAVLAAAVIQALGVAATVVRAEQLDWQTDLQAALAGAKATGRTVLVACSIPVVERDRERNFHSAAPEQERRPR